MCVALFSVDKYVYGDLANCLWDERRLAAEENGRIICSLSFMFAAKSLIFYKHFSRAKKQFINKKKFVLYPRP